MMTETPLHLFAFTASEAIGAVNGDLPGVADQAQTINAASHYIVQTDMYVYAAGANGVSITNARINTPSLRKIVIPSVQPVEVGATFGDLFAYCDFSEFPLMIAALDELTMEASGTQAAPERQRGFVVAGRRKVPATNGPMFTMRATAAIVFAAEGWTAGAIVFDQTLPPGRYQVIGASCVGANLAFFRLVFPGMGWRPGWPGRTANNIDDWKGGRAGNLGAWGEFEHTAPPLLECFGSGAGTTQTLFLDCVKVR